MSSSMGIKNTSRYPLLVLGNVPFVAVRNMWVVIRLQTYVRGVGTKDISMNTEHNF